MRPVATRCKRNLSALRFPNRVDTHRLPSYVPWHFAEHPESDLSAHPSKYDCTVVIVTWNRLDKLGAAIDSVFRQTIADRLEVIVVDNGSEDGTIAWLRESKHPVRILSYRSNMGASTARNAGIHAATAAHVCFLDSDAVLLSTNAIERCLEAVKSGPERAVGGAIWLDAEKTKPFCFGGYVTPEGHFDGERSRSDSDDPDFLSTCFAVWEKSLLEELRGFNPWYFWGIEDLDISLRARANARRRADSAATRYRVLMDIHAHHDMARQGRQYQFDDWARVFRSIERQRLYLVLSYAGIAGFVKVLLSGPFRLKRIQTSAWERRLSLKEKFLSVGWFPFLRLLCLPIDLISQRRDFLKGTPAPVEIDQTR